MWANLRANKAQGVNIVASILCLLDPVKLGIYSTPNSL